MLLPNVGLGELVVLVIVALVVFGPNRLPEMMRSAGKAFRAFQTESQRAMAELRDAVDIGDIQKDLSKVVMDEPDEMARKNEQVAAAAAAAVAAKAAEESAKKAAARKAPAKKTPAKKTAAKKTAAKKTPAKKAPAKKTPAKKTPAKKAAAAVEAVPAPMPEPSPSGYPATEDT